MELLRIREATMANNEDMDAFYKIIIEDVIRNVRVDFINMGIDEQVLVDMQESWESKLNQNKRSQSNAGETVGTEPQPFPGNTGRHVEAAGQITLSKHPFYELNARSTIGIAKGQLPSLTSVINYASQSYSETNVNETAGSLQNNTMFTANNRGSSNIFSEFEFDEFLPQPPSKRFHNNNQLDGIYDRNNNPYSNPSASVDQSSHSSAASSQNAEFDPSRGNATGEGGESSYSQTAANSHLLTQKNSSHTENYSSSSLEETTSEEEEEEDQIEDLGGNVILCQYEKVTRIKNKWKCILKDGMLHIDNKDYAFHRATCDFEW